MINQRRQASTGGASFDPSLSSTRLRLRGGRGIICNCYCRFIKFRRLLWRFDSFTFSSINFGSSFRFGLGASAFALAAASTSASVILSASGFCFSVSMPIYSFGNFEAGKSGCFSIIDQSPIDSVKTVLLSRNLRFTAHTNETL